MRNSYQFLIKSKSNGNLTLHIQHCTGFKMDMYQDDGAADESHMSRCYRQCLFFNLVNSFHLSGMMKIQTQEMKMA